MAYYSDNFEDCEGKKIKVRWTKETWDYHLRKHPELADFKNTSGLIEGAILYPNVLMEGFRKNEKNEKLRCYYKFHQSHQQLTKYTKVVVGISNKEFYVKTLRKEWALEHLIIQEEKYETFKRII